MTRSIDSNTPMRSVRGLLAAGALLAGAAAPASAQITFTGTTTYAYTATYNAAYQSLSYGNSVTIGNGGAEGSLTLGNSHDTVFPNGFNKTTNPTGPNSGSASLSVTTNGIGAWDLAFGTNTYDQYVYIKTVFNPPNGTPTDVYFVGQLNGGGATTNNNSNLGVAFQFATNGVGQTALIPYTESPYWYGFYQYFINGQTIANGTTALNGGVQETHFIDPTITPEPASMFLLGTGLLGVVGIARRRRNK